MAEPARTRAGDGARRRALSGVAAAARLALSPAAARGAAVEAAWTGAHVAAYPFGFLRESRPVVERYRTGDLAPHRRGLVVRDVEAAGTPILLVHGVADNRSAFAVLRRHLRRRGFDRVVTTNYSALTNDVRAAAADLGGVVEGLVAETGYERVHVVGHSLGGLLARYYVQRLGGHERVHTLVTLGTPHSGTHAARLLPTALGRQLRPGSDLVTELEQPAPGCTTRVIAYWTALDHLVVPAHHARADHPDLRAHSVQVQGVGHNSLPVDARVAHQIACALSELGADGRAVARGATPLPSAGGAAPAPAVPDGAARAPRSARASRRGRSAAAGA